MELPIKLAVAIILGIIVLAAMSIFLINTSKPMPEHVDLQKAYYRGCEILAKNGCNFDITVEGRNFKDIINELGYSKDDVKKQCCIS